jgi:hypothetical protein
MSESAPSLSIDLSPDQLGPAGLRAELHILDVVVGEHRSDEERLQDSSLRTFVVSALLGQSYPPPGNIKVNFDATDGESYIRIPDQYRHSRVRSADGIFEIQKNARGEESLIRFECEARSVREARELFLKIVLPFFDHQAYLANCPLLVTKIKVEDPHNLRVSLEYISPYRDVTISPHLKVLHAELAPIYALYRDAKNSHSDFYAFLCFHKILDGLFGSLRTKLRTMAVKQKRQLTVRRDLVPASEDIAAEHQCWIGKPIKSFYDTVMTPQFRNAVAHFITKDGAVLNLSSPKEMGRYAAIVFISELCVRTAIDTYITWLAELAE